MAVLTSMKHTVNSLNRGFLRDFTFHGIFHFPHADDQQNGKLHPFPISTCAHHCTIQRLVSCFYEWKVLLGMGSYHVRKWTVAIHPTPPTPTPPHPQQLIRRNLEKQTNKETRIPWYHCIIMTSWGRTIRFPEKKNSPCVSRGKFY